MRSLLHLRHLFRSRNSRRTTGNETRLKKKVNQDESARIKRTIHLQKSRNTITPFAVDRRMNIEKESRGRLRRNATEQDAGLANSSLPPPKAEAEARSRRVEDLILSRRACTNRFFHESTPPRHTRSDDWIRWRTTCFRGNPRKTPRLLWIRNRPIYIALLTVQFSHCASFHDVNYLGLKR